MQAVALHRAYKKGMKFFHEQSVGSLVYGRYVLLPLRLIGVGGIGR